ncbi:MAG: hypothetical protein Q8880_02215 [Bacteroidota bacterium]|nr:hypothetical protein [Bacteroidota bacterium]
MAEPSCPKCCNKTFESKSMKVNNHPNQIFFIYCSSCGYIISLIDKTKIPNEKVIQK